MTPLVYTMPTSRTSITVSFQLVGRKLLYIFKENSSSNAFYLFLPLFKHQTTPYNVLFFQKMKKYAFLFSFQTGAGSQWEGPHNNNKATCLQSKFTIHYILLFLLTIPLYSVNLCNKYYKTSPNIYFSFFFTLKSLNLNYFCNNSIYPRFHTG